MLLPGVKKHADYANEFSETLKKLHRIHQVLTFCYLPLLITCMGFSCYFAYLSGSTGAYTDPGKDWEACYTTSNAVQAPLSPILSAIGEKVTETLACTVQGVGEPTCSTNCSDAIAATCT